MLDDLDAVAAHVPMNPRDYLVLLCLQVGPRHGYGIIREVEEQSHGLVRMDPSNLYRGIRRLIRDGLVERTEAPAPEPDEVTRNYYGVTSLGRRVARTEAARLDALTRVAEERDLLPKTDG